MEKTQSRHQPCHQRPGRHTTKSCLAMASGPAPSPPWCAVRKTERIWGAQLCPAAITPLPAPWCQRALCKDLTSTSSPRSNEAYLFLPVSVRGGTGKVANLTPLQWSVEAPREQAQGGVSRELAGSLKSHLCSAETRHSPGVGEREEVRFALTQGG